MKVGSVCIICMLVVVLLLDLATDVEGVRVRRTGSTRRSYRKPTTRRTSTRRVRLPTTFYSSVSSSKLRRSNPSSFTRGFLAGSLVVYALSSAPIYGNRYYPYRTSYYHIPRDRALRIKQEEYRMQQIDGRNCTGCTMKQSPTEYVTSVNTTVSYVVDSGKTGTSVLSPQVASNNEITNVTIKEAVDKYLIKMETKTQYNDSVFTDCNCTVFTITTQAYMVKVTSAASCYSHRFATVLAALILGYYYARV